MLDVQTTEAFVFGSAIQSGRCSEPRDWFARWPTARCKNAPLGAAVHSQEECGYQLTKEHVTSERVGGQLRQVLRCPACRQDSTHGQYRGRCSDCGKACVLLRMGTRYTEICDCRQTDEDRRRMAEREAVETRKQEERKRRQEEELRLLVLQSDAEDCWERKGGVCLVRRERPVMPFCGHCPKFR